ncbi:hypothetical protein MHYP_G00266100 [Metynnis hypsauchen]
MDILVFKHGVRDGQTVVCTEVQKPNTTQVQIREAIPPNHTPPGLTVIAHTAVRTRSPTRRRREATLSSTGENPNIQAPSRGAMRKPTPARRLSPWATPEKNKVQPLSRRLDPEPKLCVEVSPTISSRYLSTSRTNSGSFPASEVMFQVPKASFSNRGSERQGPCLRTLPDLQSTEPLLLPLPLVVGRWEGGLM